MTPHIYIYIYICVCVCVCVCVHVCLYLHKCIYTYQNAVAHTIISVYGIDKRGCQFCYLIHCSLDSPLPEYPPRSQKKYQVRNPKHISFSMNSFFFLSSFLLYFLFDSIFIYLHQFFFFGIFISIFFFCLLIF